jgi:hypothetical protein
MHVTRRSFLMASAATLALPAAAALAAESVFTIGAPMDPPEWALLERELLHAHTAACVKFFQRYFDPANGWLETTPRYGGDDGPDDAIENVNDWPHLYALGGDDVIREMYTKAYEGHVQQYSAQKTTDVPIAKDGMYYKEFPSQFDWQHNGEGLTVFNLMPLGAPYSRRYKERVQRFAGFYMDEDPGAPNYDPKLKLIKSMMNGSRGPMLRDATPLDWTGDPIDVKDRFPSLGHGEDDYKMMLQHFVGYEDVVGDQPLNLASTQLATNAYMLTHQKKYKDWVLSYCDAWVQRAKDNGGIIPSKVGVDGKIGGPKNQWWGSAYGWGFSPIVPMTGKPSDRNRVPWCFSGFMNAYLLSKGDDKYLDVWRKTADKFDAASKVVDGKKSAPYMFGAQGFYSFKPGNYNLNFLEIYALSMKPADRARCEETEWYNYLEGKNPAYPVKALREGLARIRHQMELVDRDSTSADMRLADSALDLNPASIKALTQLIEGGLYLQHGGGWARSSPAQGGSLLYTRLRYFDPVRRRAGLPQDVAALVDSWGPDSLTLNLVNLSPSVARSVIVQGGAYAEHQIVSVSDGKTVMDVNAPNFPVRLAPGAGAKLTIKMKRFSNDPSLSFPWESTIADLGNPPDIANYVHKSSGVP